MWFSKKKRLQLNVEKCMVLVMSNNKYCVVYPRLKIDGKAVKCVYEIVYLGEQFNYMGSNKDLIEDRMKKGRVCIINAMALCNEVTMGVYAIETLLLLYKSFFLQVVLYNSQAWCNLTTKELASLKTIQLKYLKRIFHAPSSTSNPITLLETGTLPIEQEINKRQLNFLHHVLLISLEENDPVKIVYQEQLKFEDEKNWGNEVRKVRQRYDLLETDDEIAAYSKETWKGIVKRKLKSFALQQLNEELSQQRQGSKLSPYTELKQQEYLVALTPQQARKAFHVRAGILNIKAVRKYWYKDTECRLCGGEEEDVNHVVNDCKAVPRCSRIGSVLSNDLPEIKEIADRCILFGTLVKELEGEQAGVV